MKPSIHPQFNTNAKVSCACGNTFSTGSILQELRTEICSNCHPFYTGKQKFLDIQGRVDKFKKKTTIAAQIKSTAKPKKARKTRAKV